MIMQKNNAEVIANSIHNLYKKKLITSPDPTSQDLTCGEDDEEMPDAEIQTPTKQKKRKVEDESNNGQEIESSQEMTT